MKRILPQSLFDGTRTHYDTVVVLDEGNIVGFDQPKGDEEQLPGMLVPGFIDVQVNGGGGALFNSEPNEHCIETIIRTHCKFGSTGILPTLITDSVEVMAKAADAIARVIADKMPGILGVHFEGPHLSVAKKGVHSEAHIRSLSDEEKTIFARDDIGIKVVTLAPENVSTDDIRFLVENDVKVCLGHSNADYEQTMRALDAGATGFTHLFNAMSPMNSRSPGVVGAALADENSWCGLIVDGHHVHPGAAKVALAAKAQGKIMLVTDAMSPVGTTDEQFELLGAQVIRTGDRLNALTGQLAGSVLDMAAAVRKTVQTLGVSREEALKMASVYPAEFLGLAGMRGRMAPGFKADLVLLDEGLNVTGTWIAGQKIYEKS